MRLVCLICKQSYPVNKIRYSCDCGGTLDVEYDFSKTPCGQELKNSFFKRGSQEVVHHLSGVWRYRELLPSVPDKYLISRGEGYTGLYENSRITKYTGIKNIFLKHEGENPSGSFKDRGMTVAITIGKWLGANIFACASTGNTSASLGAYTAAAGLKGVIFIPDNKISYGKLSQALAYGVKTLQIKGDFDAAMKLVQEVTQKRKIYLLNSLNPFRVEGQKTIILELLEQLNWKVPDWIVVPGGNLGNTAAFGKVLMEAKKLKLIDRLPRLAVIQAEGANPFYRSFKTGFKKLIPIEAHTVATAIRIGNPVSFDRAKRSILETDGVVESVTDQEIMEAKAVIDSSGIGCEPASAASVAGILKLRKSGVIKASKIVVGILTGNLLKDPDTTVKYHLKQLPGMEKSKLGNQPLVIEANLKSVDQALKR